MADLNIAPIEASAISATEKVFDTLYDAVVSIALPPGTRVSENEIAKQLGVSRQPVRDAFFRLSKLGFLSIKPQRATLITPISLDAIRSAVFIRTALEAECLRAAMAMPDQALLTALEANLEKQKQAIEAPSAEFLQLDEEFHEIICTVPGHAHVWELIREHKAHLDRIRFLTLSHAHRPVVIVEHAHIIHAIAAEDVATAEAALRAHIVGVTGVAKAIQDDHPLYFEDAS